MVAIATVSPHMTSFDEMKTRRFVYFVSNLSSSCLFIPSSHQWLVIFRERRQSAVLCRVPLGT